MYRCNRYVKWIQLGRFEWWTSEEKKWNQPSSKSSGSQNQLANMAPTYSVCSRCVVAPFLPFLLFPFCDDSLSSWVLMLFFWPSKYYALLPCDGEKRNWLVIDNELSLSQLTFLLLCSSFDQRATIALNFLALFKKSRRFNSFTLSRYVSPCAKAPNAVIVQVDECKKAVHQRP